MKLDIFTKSCLMAIAISLGFIAAHFPPLKRSVRGELAGEYKVVKAQESAEMIQNQLNQFRLEGWKLITPYSSCGNDKGIYLILQKRRK